MCATLTCRLYERTRDSISRSVLMTAIHLLLNPPLHRIAKIPLNMRMHDLTCDVLATNTQRFSSNRVVAPTLQYTIGIFVSRAQHT
jgi:hypothetical protein